MRSRDIDMIPSLFIQNSVMALRIKGKQFRPVGPSHANPILEYGVIPAGPVDVERSWQNQKAFVERFVSELQKSNESLFGKGNSVIKAVRTIEYLSQFEVVSFGPNVGTGKTVLGCDAVSGATVKQKFQ